MIAHTRAVIERGAVVRQLFSEPPLTLRQVHSDDPACASLCLVGSAAGPLAGDVLSLALDLGQRACAELTATGATIAQGHGSRPGRLGTEITLAAESSLRADPGPLIVCADGTVEVDLTIELDPTATLNWREVLVLGRTGEAPGAARLRWQVRRAGRPLLRQTIDLTRPELVRWPGMLAGARVMISELAVHPGRLARTVVHSPTAVTQRIADDATLTTMLADDVCSVLASRRHIDG
jgi:urease accessory protein